MHPEAGQCFGYTARQTCNVTVLLQVFRNKEHDHQAAGSSGKFAWPFASSSLRLPSLILNPKPLSFPHLQLFQIGVVVYKIMGTVIIALAFVLPVSRYARFFQIKDCVMCI